MRKIWNSWTHDEPDCRSEFEGAGLSDDGCRWDESESRLVPKGGVENAFAQSMAEALERVLDLRGARYERVARVKRAIEAGTYSVPARDLARKLVRNMLGEFR